MANHPKVVAIIDELDRLGVRQRDLVWTDDARRPFNPKDPNHPPALKSYLTGIEVPPEAACERCKRNGYPLKGCVVVLNEDGDYKHKACTNCQWYHRSPSCSFKHTKPCTNLRVQGLPLGEFAVACKVHCDNACQETNTQASLHNADPVPGNVDGDDDNELFVRQDEGAVVQSQSHDQKVVAESLESQRLVCSLHEVCPSPPAFAVEPTVAHDSTSPHRLPSVYYSTPMSINLPIRPGLFETHLTDFTPFRAPPIATAGPYEAAMAMKTYSPHTRHDHEHDHHYTGSGSTLLYPQLIQGSGHLGTTPASLALPLAPAPETHLSTQEHGPGNKELNQDENPGIKSHEPIHALRQIKIQGSLDPRLLPE